MRSRAEIETLREARLEVEGGVTSHRSCRRASAVRRAVEGGSVVKATNLCHLSHSLMHNKGQMRRVALSSDSKLGRKVEKDRGRAL